MGVVWNTRLSAEDYVASATNRARMMLFYQKRSFTAFPPVFLSPCTKFYPPKCWVWYSSIPTYLATQRLALNIVKGLRLAPYITALQHLRLFSLTPVEIKCPCSRSPKVFWNSPWSPPSYIQTANYYAATPISSTNREVVPAIANTLSPFGLSQFGKNCRLRKQRIFGAILQDTPGRQLAAPVPWGTHTTHLLPQPIPSAHIDPRKKNHTQMTLLTYPHHPTWSFIVVLTAY